METTDSTTVATTDPTFGLDTFGDVTVDPAGRPVPADQVIRNVVAEAVLADHVGVDAFGLGEHHRPDFAVTAPEVVLAAIAARTENIRLGTAVTVLSSDDPVRVYERFATLDAVSDGRAEITLGRGSFVESFPLFGYDLADYENLFEEKLDLFAALRSEQPVTWSGSTRTALHAADVHPKTAAGAIPTWVGVGGSPQSVVRAARYGFALMLAIIGGDPARFAPYSRLYRQALAEFGHAPQPVGVHAPGLVADTDAEAIELAWPHFQAMRDRIGQERGWGPTSRAEFERDIASGAQHVGSPDTVARKIAQTLRATGANRFDLKYSMGTLPHDVLMHGIELYGTDVIPRVRRLLAAPTAPVAANVG
ncbi:LLM class flavin-dependent oxidoreductase [Skermania piniformis]|uniref:LLM class flavin-dependent oxidoreductase n=1 Tax=Skermania pinensis TaxID=39122 RepID=A0ABX8S4V7_9ACTN|nr:LLM class flavin-dependent oxidoreductase [Skermania piniformis]QXQ12862.1 LLM class flavin-dependent oxidoreductase [Skermania piniformis]